MLKILYNTEMNRQQKYFETVMDFYQQGKTFVTVTLVDIVGSAPQNAGARMLVDLTGRCWGTIGGGKIEQHCIHRALDLIQNETGSDHCFAEWNLQTDIGMTCGGVGRFYFEMHRPHFWQIAVFGAGHVAQALIPILCTLNCQVLCFDTRSEWIDALPVATNLKAQVVADLAEQVLHLNTQTFIVSMTMGHAHDVPILAAVFQRQLGNPGAFPFIGVIGSPAKAGVIKRDLKKMGINSDALSKLTCPIGLPLGSNAPAEIAISIAGQLIQERDRVFQTHQKWMQAAYQGL